VSAEHGRPDGSGPTQFDELNEVLGDLVAEAGDVLGDNLVGAYLQGSFALGAGDEQSDGDFVFAIRQPLSAQQELGLRALHSDIPTRPGHWTHDLEGSYAPIRDLADPDAIGRDWLFVDHGWREMDWSPHCNTEVARWTLREHGITLTGPPPRELVAEVPAAALQMRMRRDVATCMEDVQSWVSLDLAWGQRYVVTTLCRTAFTAEHGTVTSKLGALEWAQAALDPQWTRLLDQVLTDRVLGFDPDGRTRPGSVEETRAFNDYVVDRVTSRGDLPPS